MPVAGLSSIAASAGLERQGVDDREQHRQRDRDGELLIQPPVIPPMKPTGTNTALRISPMAITGPETSSIALIVASFGAIPCSMWCITASTTTIASSTTMPMANTGRAARAR